MKYGFLFKKEYNTILKLKDLSEELKAMYANSETDPLDQLIEFFSITSISHDSIGELILAKNNLHNKRFLFLSFSDVETASSLEEIIVEITKVGREVFGINRTNVGEVVSQDKVFLGNTEGLYTKSISDWRTKNDPIADHIIKKQATEFVDAHRVLCTKIDELIAKLL